MVCGGALFSDKTQLGMELEDVCWIMDTSWVRSELQLGSADALFLLLNNHPCSNIYELSTVFG